MSFERLQHRPLPWLPVVAVAISSVAWPQCALAQTASQSSFFGLSPQAMPQAAPQAPGDARLRPPSRQNDPDAPTEIQAETLSGRPDREIKLQKAVEIRRGEMVLSADQATYDVVDDRVQASGNVRIRNFGDVYTGDSVNLKMDTGQGEVSRPTFFLEKNGGRGRADRMEFESRDRVIIEEAAYTTCEGPDPDWQLRAKKLTLDREVERGSAVNGVVIFKGVPILASPQLSFPTSSERKSGVLPPSIGTSTSGGFQVQLPYYFNVAPNRDLTLLPRFFGQRGLQLGAHARYLDRTYSGQTRLEILPNDSSEKRSRWAFSSVHSQTLAPGLNLTTNLNAASDDNYPNDFPGTITTAARRVLNRDVNLNLVRSEGTAYVRASNYQILQDPLSPIDRPYDRLPQIGGSHFKRDVGGFDLNTDVDLTNFWHPEKIRGSRLVVNPRVSYPIVAPGWFLTPSASLHASSYSLGNQTGGTQTTSTSINRALPTFSLNSGLTFERETRFLGQAATQTLEPRLFYVYTPYQNQSNVPLFDTALADFNYTQVFRENRYAGNDRISDANQITAALASRFIEASGIQRMNVALAQRFYFNPQRVVAGDAGVATASAETKSDLLLLGTGQVTSTLAVDSNFQYSQSLGQMVRSNFGVRWRPGVNRVLNVQYRRDRTSATAPFQLFDVSAQWPLSPRLYGVARVNYSLEERRVAETVGGLEYKADCWVFRVVGQRLPTGTGVASTSLFFQLELSGLSRVGSNPMQILRTNVPGYQPVSATPALMQNVPGTY